MCGGSGECYKVTELKVKVNWLDLEVGSKARVTDVKVKVSALNLKVKVN
jgi:hypothetical protein